MDWSSEIWANSPRYNFFKFEIDVKICVIWVYVASSGLKYMQKLVKEPNTSTSLTNFFF